MKSQLVNIDDHGGIYSALKFVCPGCATDGSSGLHILPVNTELHKPSWDFDGNLELPTVSPSILTKGGRPGSESICHSFLKAGVFQFLTDSTHSMSGQFVDIPDLPDWAVEN